MEPSCCETSTTSVKTKMTLYRVYNVDFGPKIDVVQGLKVYHVGYCHNRRCISYTTSDFALTGVVFVFFLYNKRIIYKPLPCIRKLARTVPLIDENSSSIDYVYIIYIYTYISCDIIHIYIYTN